jgi:hypothetical protein
MLLRALTPSTNVLVILPAVDPDHWRSSQASRLRLIYRNAPKGDRDGSFECDERRLCAPFKGFDELRHSAGHLGEARTQRRRPGGSIDPIFRDGFLLDSIFPEEVA